MNMKKKRSRLLSALLVLCMVLTLLPAMGTTALAADAPGITVLRDDYITSSSGVGWTWECNAASGTLTLNGYNGGPISINGGAYGGDVSIVLEGNNTVTTTEAAYGIMLVSVNQATFSGSGNLTVNNHHAETQRTVIGIGTFVGGPVCDGNITFNGTGTVSVNVSSQSAESRVYGIASGRLLQVLNTKSKIMIGTGATVNVDLSTCSVTPTAAIAGNDSITLDGTVSITCHSTATNPHSCYGLYSAASDATISIGSESTVSIDTPDGGRWTNYAAQLTAAGTLSLDHAMQANGTRLTYGATATLIEKNMWNTGVYSDCSYYHFSATHTHTGGTATCKTLAVCEICHQPYGSYGGHSFVDDVCTVCGYEDISSTGLFPVQPQSGTVLTNEVYSITWELGALYSTANTHMQYYVDGEWKGCAEVSNNSLLRVTSNTAKTQQYRLDVLRNGFHYYSDVISVTWRDPNQYTVTFAAGEGSGSMTSGTATEQQGYILPGCSFTPPDGKQFKAWGIGSEEYSVGSVYTFSGNTTVTALWKDEDVYFTTQPVGASGKAGSSIWVNWTVTEGYRGVNVYLYLKGDDGTWSQVQNVQGYSRYNFTSATAAANTYRLGIAVLGSEYYSNEFTVKWLPLEEYLISYDANGGSGEMEASTIIEGNSYYLPECTLTAPSGYAFKEWLVGDNTYANYTTIPITGNTVIKPVWQKVLSDPTMPDTIVAWSGSSEVIAVSYDAAISGTVYWSYQKIFNGEWTEINSQQYPATMSLSVAADLLATLGAGTYRLAATVNPWYYAYTEEFDVIVVDQPQVATPMEWPNGVTSFTDDLSVDIYCDTLGAEIRYTVDGDTPTKETGTQYTGSILINGDCTLRIKAFLDGYIESDAVVISYTKVDAPETPTASVAGGSFVSDFTLQLFCATSGAMIYYTTDGTEPTEYSNTYSGNINITNTTTIKAIAYVSGIASEVSTFTYTKAEAAITNATRTDGTLGFTIEGGAAMSVYAIGAQYDSDGKMTDVKISSVYALTSSSSNSCYLNGFTHETGYTYKLFLVKYGTYAPPCGAVDVN